MTSASKPSALDAVAVRQTPLTATESPFAISTPSVVAMRNRAPSSALETSSTVPTSLTRPVNTATTPAGGPGSGRLRRPSPPRWTALEPRRRSRPAPGPPSPRGPRRGGPPGSRVGGLGRPRALDRRPAAADHHRRDEHTHLVDLP